MSQLEILRESLGQCDEIILDALIMRNRIEEDIMAYHKSSSCETISHADGAHPYYDQCRSGITDLEDSLLPPCFVYSDFQHCTVLKHNKSFQ